MKIYKFVLTVIALAILIHDAASAADWILISHDEDSEVSFDASSLKKYKDGKMTSWKKVIFLNNYKINGRKVNQIMALNGADCMKKSFRNISLYIYYADGSISESKGSKEYKYAPPETNASDFIEMICRKR